MNADFFTRIIRVNSLGPNMVLGAGDSEFKPQKVFICGRCDEVHDTSFGAEQCCPTEVYEEWECPECKASYSTLSLAESCCGTGVRQPKQCPICLRMADSYEEAVDCCMHTHPTMSLRGRQRVAAAVENGTPWPDAVAAHALE